MVESLRKHAEKIRFAAVGAANTALDFLILFILVGLGVDKIIANYFSTGLALIFSFFVNKSFTFKSKTGNAKKEFVLFIIITLIGLWVLQPVIINFVSQLLAGHGLTNGLILLIAKLIATIISLIWNYILYSKIVFKKLEEQ